MGGDVELNPSPTRCVRYGLASRTVEGRSPYPVVPAAVLFAIGSSAALALAGLVKRMVTGPAELVLVWGRHPLPQRLPAGEPL